MRAYLDLLRDIRATGRRKPQRAVLLSTGTRPDVASVFGRQIRFDLAAGFPLVTTKRVPFRAVVHELVWFLSGATNIAYLRDHGVRIWDEWADAAGELGPVYGKQWRAWDGPDGRRVDQIANLERDIRAVAADAHHTAARRLILSAWNPIDIPHVRGPSACHTLAQFDVTAGRLSCQLYQRSADMFLGVPFNIASYALLTHLFAQVCGLAVGEYVHTFGDAHIYENHWAAVDEQLTREPLPLPQLELDPAIASMDGILAEQVRLVGYQHHPALRGEVAV